MAGWKSFLGKKVQAASAAAVAGNRSAQSDERKDVGKSEGGPISTKEAGNMRNAAVTDVKRTQTDDDSLFEFANKKHFDRHGPLSLDMSDLSPINVKDDLSAEYAESEAYGPTVEERQSSSFLQRLTECATPMMTATKQSSSMFMPSTICGKNEIIEEPDSVADSSYDSLNSGEKHRRSMSFGDEKPKSASKMKDDSKTDAIRVSSSSVVSEDFGAKTAFLDSVAMKAAVSKTRRSRSSGKRRERSGNSSVASGSTNHSDRWQSFLERKRASDPSPIRSRASSSDVSRAAEKYAAQKVDEIMTKMASRSRTVTRSRDIHKEVNRQALAAEDAEEMKKSSTVNDAEDLAAARVEAMMAALSSSHLDEGEI
jgi:hypothetical protein